MLRTQLTGMLVRPGRLVMTGLAVLVAAFVVFGTVMAQQITERTVLDHFAGTPAATSLVVSADLDTAAITDAEIGAIRAVPGVAEVAARTLNGVEFPLTGTLARSLQLQGDPGHGRLSRVRVVAGHYPDGPREVAVNRQASRQLAIKPGDRIGMLFPQEKDSEKTRTVTVTVTGVVEAGSDRYATGYAPATTLNAMSRTRGYPRLDIRAEPGVSAATLSQRLRPLLKRAPGAAADFVPGDTVRAQEARAAVEQYADIFQLITMFLAVSVVAAALVATSAFRIVFAQRLRQLALLRAIGAHRGQLVRALAIEGALVGLVAGTAGVLLALGAGHATPAFVRAAGQSLSTPGVPVLTALAVVLGSVLVTAGAVLAPALSASDVSPLLALRRAGTVAGERGIGLARLGTGLLLGAGALGLIGVIFSDLPEPGDQSYDSTGGLTVTVLSGALAFLTLVVLGPLLVRPVLAVAGWPLRRLGPTGTLAVGGVGGAPRRAAAVSVVVALGVTLVSGTLVGLASLQGSMDRKSAVEAPADFDLIGGDKGLSSEVVRRIKALPELADATDYRMPEITVGGTDAVATDVDLAALPSSRRLYPADGTLSDLGPGRVIVDAQLAKELGVTAGDSLTLTLPSAKKGTVRATVAATLPGNAPLNADVIVAPTDLDHMGASRLRTGVLANAAARGQAARNAAETAIQRTVGPDSGADLRVLAEDRDNSNADIGVMATMSLGLLGLTVLMAVIGVGTTTGLTVLERTGESGLLRALGLGRSGLRLMIGMEAGLYGVIGGVLGLALGVPYAWLTIRVLNIDAPLLLPYGQLLVVFLGLVGVTALAGLLPARRAAQVSPVVAMGTTE
ncbi:ABC transporter permease [Streptomyces sp. NBC_01262]|uniref:ABC transporter permease n=1 Tax=Streptomyces sp. NBC_01262 TaxID=2903803 RepID=UPI002E31FB17|nr:ABC transporter permease [Streptomyces sp. NBC_01262]